MPHINESVFFLIKSNAKIFYFTSIYVLNYSIIFSFEVLVYKIGKSKGSCSMSDFGGKLDDWLTFQCELRGAATFSSPCPAALLGKCTTGLNHFLFGLVRIKPEERIRWITPQQLCPYGVSSPLFPDLMTENNGVSTVWAVKKFFLVNLKQK